MSATHSSDLVGQLLAAGRGSGGRRLIVQGDATSGGSYWMGISFKPVSSLFEAVLRGALSGDYDRVIAFTGAGANSLPRHLRLAANLSLGDEPLIWLAKGEPVAAQARPAQARAAWDLLTDLAPTRLDRVLWRGAHQTYWTRIRKLLEHRDKELASGLRIALLVDYQYLEPSGADWNLFDGTTSLGLTAADSNSITDRFAVRAETLGRADMIFFGEDPLVRQLTGPSSFLHSLCTRKVSRWDEMAPKIEPLLPSMRLNDADVVEARRVQNPLQPFLETNRENGAPLYDLLRHSAISHRASVATVPRDPRRIALEFWASLDLEPLQRAFETEIIGQTRVKSEILRVLGAHSNRCRRLLSANPRVERTANDREYLPPVIGLFGAAGMGKTTFCRVMARSLFGDESFTRLVDLSSKLLSTETIGVAPPYQGNDQESNLMRYARETGGLGLFCFDEFTRIQRHQESLAEALSPLLEIIESRSFTPANARFVPANGRYYLTNTIFVFSGNLARPDEVTPVGFTSVDDLGDAFKRRVFGKGEIFYFESLHSADYEPALSSALRRHTSRILRDFFPDRAAGFVIAIEPSLLGDLVQRFDNNLRESGSAASLALLDGLIQRLQLDRAVENAVEQRLDVVHLTREVLP